MNTLFCPTTGIVVFFDVVKGMPADVAERVKQHGGFWPALVSVLPALADGVVWAADVNGNARYHVAVKNSADVGRFLQLLHSRCWLAGFGWYETDETGQLIERSLVIHS